jgi:pSer/pThr/pTyr-binding forkhead associated (FHA) protein
VSPRHARIVVAGGAVQIEDLGTRSGTVLDDRRISGPTPLAEGDRVRLGDVTFTFRMDPGPAAR